MFEDLKNIKSTKKELREFGLTVGIILVILGAFVLWRGKEEARDLVPYLFGIAAFLIVFGIALPGILKPLQK